MWEGDGDRKDIERGRDGEGEREEQEIDMWEEENRMWDGYG